MVARGCGVAMSACAKSSAPMSVLSGGVFGSATDDLTDLRNLVDEIGARSFAERIGGRSLPDAFDATAWRHLEEAGLTRLSSAPSPEAVRPRPPVPGHSPGHAVSVPVAETDVLAGWLAARAGLEVPEAGRRPWPPNSMRCPMRARRPLSCAGLYRRERLRAAVRTPAELSITRHNAGGEPRDTVRTPHDGFVTVDAATELTRRGASARWCSDDRRPGCRRRVLRRAHPRTRAAPAVRSAPSSPSSTRWPVWPVRWSARAATDLAAAAAADHGFGSDQDEFRGHGRESDPWDRWCRR